MTPLDRAAGSLAMLKCSGGLTHGNRDCVFALPFVQAQNFTNSSAACKRSDGPDLVKTAFQVPGLCGGADAIGDFVTRDPRLEKFPTADEFLFCQSHRSGRTGAYCVPRAGVDHVVEVPTVAEGSIYKGGVKRVGSVAIIDHR